MQIPVKVLTAQQVGELLEVEESHFMDLKGRAIAPGKLTKAISAFANTSGGELFVGIEEEEGPDGKFRSWNGFTDQEATNGIFQTIQALNPLGNNYDAEFLSGEGQSGIVLHLTIHKSQDIVSSTDGKSTFGGRRKACRCRMRKR